MSQPRTASRRRFRLALAALGLAGLIGASAPSRPAAARPISLQPRSRVAEAAPAAPLAQAGAACGVYPIAFHQQLLELNPTTGGPGPEPMPDPSAPINEIPAASRFRVSFSGTLRYGYFLTWTGNQTSAELEAALAGGGTLGAGFIEAVPPPSDPSAGRRVNGVLEAGDWIIATISVSLSGGGAAALDQHIARRTPMILPVFNAMAGSGSQLELRTWGFASVRLLGYAFTGNMNYLELALVDPQTPYACFRYQTPALVGQTAIITPSMPLSATLERRWDFGDGSPVSTALTPTHAYAQPGAYTVTLTLPHTTTVRAVGRIEVTRPLLPPQLFLPGLLR